MNEWLRRERLAELPDETRWVEKKYLSFQLTKEELCPHRPQPPENVGQLERLRSANAEHVDRRRIRTERHRSAVARSPREALLPEGDLPVRNHQADVSIEQTELSHGWLGCTRRQLRIVVHLLDRLTRCERIRGNARSDLLFTSYVSDPRAPRGVSRKTIYRAPAFAVWPAEVVDLCLREIVAVVDWCAGDMFCA